MCSSDLVYILPPLQVLPKTKIANLKSLTKDHVPLLTKMYDKAKSLTKGMSYLTTSYIFCAMDI